MKRFACFKEVTVFGGATVDRIGRSTAPAVMGASNPGDVRVLPGGVGLNASAVLARLGLKTELVARVGADADAELIIDAARDAGVDSRLVSISQTMPTATYHATFDRDGSLLVGIADMSVYDELTPALAAAAIAAAPPSSVWVVDANLPAETLAFIVGEANATDRGIAALSVSPAKARRLAPLVDRVTVLFANRREAAAILDREWTGKGPTAAELASGLVLAGVGGAVVTDSSDPLSVATGSDVRSLVPFRAAVQSVNGAGDAFAAGTLYGLATGKSLCEAVFPGLAAAALTVESEDTSRRDLSPALLSDYLASIRGHAA
jgi:pseudouridine kinase